MRLQLVGTVRLTDDAGVDRTPRSVKARAVLAMLTSVPERRRSRRWLESRLWSDRGPEQAAGSLRQALMQIRRSLGPHTTILGSDREAVWIDGIEPDSDADSEAGSAGREFLEGFDIPDPAFEDWLRQERAIRSGAHQVAVPAPLAPPQSNGATVLPVILNPGRETGDAIGFLSQALADAIGALIGEFAEVDIFTAGDSVTEVTLPERGFTVTVDCLPSQTRQHVRVSLADSGSGKVYWSRAALIEGTPADGLLADEFPQIVFQTADAAFGVAAAMPRRGIDTAWADARIAAAVRAMFTFDRNRIAEADRILADVIETAANARAYAWRAHLCQIAAVERTGEDWNQLAAQADEYARKALEIPEDNPLVLALASQIRVMLDGDPETGYALATDALSASPHNAFAHAAIGCAHLRAGQSEQALEAARTGARIAGRSSFQPWWQMLAGLAAMSLERYEEATHHYQAAYARAPGFRAPMRHLYVLHRAGGRADQAERVLLALRRLEPDFSLRRIKDDPAYPAATLRSSGLISRAMAQPVD